MSHHETPGLQVNPKRLWVTLMQLKEIGASDDAATGLRGVKRLALTDEDDEAPRLVVSWMQEAGMNVRATRAATSTPSALAETAACPVC